MNLLTRRAFLERLSALAAGNFIASTAALSARADDNPEPHIAFPSAPRDRIAVASYPFRAAATFARWIPRTSQSSAEP
jgi:hypothetical protein